MQAGLGLVRNRHGNQFHTRICVPKDLAPLLGRAEMRLSLGTEQRRYAIQAARLIHARKITAFDEMRAAMNKDNPKPTPEQQAEARKRFLTLIQQRQQAQAATTDHKEEAVDAARYASAADEQQEDRELLALLERDPEAVSAFFEVMRDQMAAGQVAEAAIAAALAALQAAEAGRQAAIQVAATNINKATEAEQRAEKSAATVGRMAINHASERARMATEHASQLANVTMAALVRSGASTAPDKDKADLPSVRFSEVLAAYQESTEFKKRAARTNQQYVSETGRFIQAMGDMFIKDISGQTMRAFLDIEKELPPNINKVKRYKGLTLQEISQLNANEDGETVELSTALQRITRVNTLFEWALGQDAPEKWGFPKEKNPCAGFKDKYFTRDEIRELEDGEHTRRAFNDEDLRRVFTGKIEEVSGKGRRVFEYGYGARCFKKRYQYWLPLLALFTGARANELAQLRISDIRDAQGIPYFDFNEEADADKLKRKSLKTKTSKRSVPIHRKLIELGFLDYVQELERAGHWCLFQELNPENAKADGDTPRPVYNSQMTNWFFRYRKACNVLKNPEGKPVFHSFRHTAATRLENADVQPHRSSGILGHLQEGETLQTYTRLDKGKLRVELEKMEFPADVMDALPHWRDIKFQDKGKDCPMPPPAKLGVSAKRSGSSENAAA